MQFDWKCFFEILNAVWGTSQKEIARYLDINESTITRLKQKKIANSRQSVSGMYRHLFDLANTQSMAYSMYKNSANAEKEILNLWQDELTERKLKDLIKDLELNNYEFFFKGLLRLLLEKPSSTLVNQPDALCNNTPTQMQRRSIDKKPQKIQNELYHSFEAYGINAFIVSA